MDHRDDIEDLVRTRLRSLRTTLGLSLDELGARTSLSPSTISRVETGKRTISLDILVPLARALQVDLLQSLHGAEVLGDPPELECRGGRRVHGRFVPRLGRPEGRPNR